MAILCPYNTFSEVLEDTKESNLVGSDKLNCDQEIASQRNFNGPSFIFEHLQHGSQFSLAIFAQNQKVSDLKNFFTEEKSMMIVDLFFEWMPFM